jgi:K+-transporting ATPase ATPase C chain
MEIRSVILPSILFLLIFTLITGMFYPILVTGIAQVAFPYQANGSLIERDGVMLGSELIGQQFDDPAYFWGRLSATGPFPYNSAASSGSNYGQTTQALYDMISDRAEELRAADPDNVAPIPVDLVTASGSGLDPHISPAAAFYQVARVARERGLDENVVHQLVEDQIEQPFLGFWGEPRVNVLLLNLALDELG